MTQQGPRGAVVRVLVGLAVVALVGAGALLAIGPNRTADWKASDCGAPIRWLTDDHPYETVLVPYGDGSDPYGPAAARDDCRALVWHQIHWAAELGAAGLGLVAASVVMAHTRRRRRAPAALITA